MRPHILIVDDDLELQLLFRIILEHDFEISQATCGEQAVALARASKLDLILLDVMLPDIDGFEVCRQLKADDRTSATPIIFVTARSDISSLVDQIKPPIEDVIKKPFGPRDLLQRINRIVQRPAVSREPSAHLSVLAQV